MLSDDDIGFTMFTSVSSARMLRTKHEDIIGKRLPSVAAKLDITKSFWSSEETEGTGKDVFFSWTFSQAKIGSRWTEVRLCVHPLMSF